MQFKEVLSVDCSDADNPAETLFNIALALADRYDLCVICLVNHLQEGVASMVADKRLSHGVDPKTVMRQTSETGSVH